MRVDFRTDRIDIDEGTRQGAERSVLLALGRFAPRVPHVVVSIEDAAPEATRAGRHYQVVLHVGGLRRFLVLEHDRDLHAAIGRAADRARRTVERDLRRVAWGVASRRPGSRRVPGSRRAAALRIVAPARAVPDVHAHDDEGKGRRS
jgi:hypothetical protein